MTRRDGVVEPKCEVRVSEEMKTLRSAQISLNHFLWTSELSYGFILSSKDSRLATGDELVSVTLSNITAEAWYPNTAGKIKYDAKVTSFLEQVSANQTLVARATMIMWYTHFENYLNTRLNDLTSPSTWGPFTRTLNIDALTKADFRVKPQTILRADFCRILRNIMAHGDQQGLPDNEDHPVTQKWIKSKVNEGAQPTEVNNAVQYVVGQAVNHLKDSTANHKNVSLNFFYTLFTFTNLDTLAFEIEEALMPKDSDTKNTIYRQKRKIRRADLICTEDVS